MLLWRRWLLELLRCGTSSSSRFFDIVLVAAARRLLQRPIFILRLVVLLKAWCLLWRLEPCTAFYKLAGSRRTRRCSFLFDIRLVTSKYADLFFHDFKVTLKSVLGTLELGQLSVLALNNILEVDDFLFKLSVSLLELALQVQVLLLLLLQICQ